MASLGLYKGVAQVYGMKLRGFPAWFMHRTYHLSRMPTSTARPASSSDWTLALFFRREIVSLGALTDPRREFEYAAKGPGAPQAAPRPEAREERARQAERVRAGRSVTAGPRARGRGVSGSG